MLPPSPHRSPPSCSQQLRIVTSNLRHAPVPECLRPLETRLLRSASTRLHSRIGAGRCRLQQCTTSAGRAPAGGGSAQPVSCFSDTKSGSGATVRVVFSFLPVDPQSKLNQTKLFRSQTKPKIKKAQQNKTKVWLWCNHQRGCFFTFCQLT